MRDARSPHVWRVNLILERNPDWDDLYDTLIQRRVANATWMAGTSPAMTAFW
jgi:hypothetical protein